MKLFNGPGNSMDIPADIAMDSIGNIYITAGSIGTGFSGYLDYATIKYNSTGNSLWVQRYNAAELEDNPEAIAIDKFSNVYITGNSYDSFTSSGSLTIKYSQTLTEVHQINLNLPEGYSLQQNYPNPFNPTTEISYQLPVISEVRLTIYNLLGQEIRTLLNDQQPAGSYAVQWDGFNDSDQAVAAGVYLYRLQAGKDFVQMRKMILVK